MKYILVFWVANSMVEYSAFNRKVLGSNPRQPNFKILQLKYKVNLTF